MLPADLELPFLETRTYLHGTTLFDAMLPFAPVDAALGFKINRRIDSDRVRLEAGANREASASLVWRRGGESAAISAFAQPPSRVIRRERYDERSVSSLATIAAGSASLDRSPLGFVQTLIPLFKVLLGHEVKNMRPGQWMFTRLDLERLPNPFVPLTLEFSGAIPGVLARARVLHGMDAFGEIYFSWVAKDT